MGPMVNATALTKMNSALPFMQISIASFLVFAACLSATDAIEAGTVPEPTFAAVHAAADVADVAKAHMAVASRARSAVASRSKSKVFGKVTDTRRRRCTGDQRRRRQTCSYTCSGTMQSGYSGGSSSYTALSPSYSDTSDAATSANECLAACNEQAASVSTCSTNGGCDAGSCTYYVSASQSSWACYHREGVTSLTEDSSGTATYYSALLTCDTCNS